MTSKTIVGLIPTTIGIAPNPDCLKGVAVCQCEIGREKLLTAPIYGRVLTVSPTRGEDDAEARYQTAPCARELDQFKCPTSHILITFKSPLNPQEVFNKVFPASTPIKYVKRKLAKLLSVSNNNLLLTKNRTVLKETSLLSDLKTDALGNMAIDVYTKDSEEFALSEIPKDMYIHDFLHSLNPKKKMSFIAIKFRVPDQNESFTRSYNSITRIHEIKKNLAGLFELDPDNLVMLRGEHPLKDRMAVMDLDYDKYGIVEVELLTKDHTQFKFNKLYKENVVNEVLNVVVPYGETMKQINVEIFSEPIEKPYLGGYRNVKTGIT